MANGEGTPLHGDRGAWNTVDYPERHAKDIEDDAQVVHLPLPGTSGRLVQSDGSYWQRVEQILNSNLPDPLAFRNTATILTIASGAVTATQNIHIIAAESGTTDDLDTISGLVGRQLLLIKADTGDTITVKHGTGNIHFDSGGDFELSGNSWLLLFYDGTNAVALGAGGSGGATTFLELTDTPAAYTGEGGKIVRVNVGEDALEFDDESAGGHTIQDTGTPMTQRTNLNFIGLEVSDDAGNDATKIEIPEGAYAETIGDGIETVFTLTHNLGTKDIIVQLWDLTGTDPLEATSDASSIEATGVNTIKVTFALAPDTDAYRVIILASGGAGIGNGGGGVDYPRTAVVWHSQAKVLNGNAIERAAYNTMFYQRSFQNPPANLDEFEYTFFLDAGTYVFRFLGVRASSRGMIDWTLDGSSIVTSQDWYNSTEQLSYIFTETNVSVTSPGLHTLNGKVNGKHASSTNYYMILTAIMISEN